MLPSSLGRALATAMSSSFPCANPAVNQATPSDRRSGVEHPLADDPFVSKDCQLPFREAQTPQDLVVVLAECRRGRAVVPDRPWRDAKRPAGKAVRPGDRVVEFLVKPTRTELARHEV